MTVPYRPGLNTSVVCPHCQVRVKLPRAEPLPWIPPDADPFGVLESFPCPRCGEVIRLEGASQCASCRGTRWVCEQHADHRFPHEPGQACDGQGAPCPVCNTGNPPAMPPGFISFVKS